ncbi:MAG: DNA-binding protein WhiA [Aminobacterium sp.]|uniref:DNA-binding protein WhiA n=1 Tax=Aminobacterium sp. TaxID=1872491 RepID=UPI002B1F3C5A|nr:DNA-binding protein WhiA [Aminobacterium sp.]MEA4876324.1 DNA-binding protein WhiA [Aminobacterium sp.]
MKTLSEIMWDEWVFSPLSSTDIDSETAGILWGLLTVYPETMSQGRFVLSGRRLWVFRRLRRIWASSRWGKRLDLSSMLNVPANFRGSVTLRIPQPIMKEVIFWGENARKKSDWQWMRGVWGNCGSLYVPKTGYYLAFRFRFYKIMELVLSILKNNQFPVGKRIVDGQYELLLRDQEKIVTLLSHYKLFDTSLKLEEKAIVRAMRDKANRLVNCDASNIRKTLEAAEWQLEIAKVFQNERILNTLPETLRELIEVRMQYPSATLTELGQMLSKPVSKSTVKYRWQKLKTMAEQLPLGI